MEQCKDGEWVKYTDFADLEREHERLIELLDTYKMLYDESWKSEREAWDEVREYEQFEKETKIAHIISFIIILGLLLWNHI
jgi:hypothetical protein